jgi:hypothetical protein
MDCTHPRADTLRDPAFAAAIEYAEVAPCYALWSVAWQDGQLPDRRAMRPPRLPACTLPYLFLYETRGSRFFCRLTGTQVDAMFGRRQMGRFLDELLDGNALASRTALLQQALDTRCALLYGGDLVVPGREHVPFRRILLPLGDEEGRARFVFGAVWSTTRDTPMRRPTQYTIDSDLMLVERPVR